MNDSKVLKAEFFEIIEKIVEELIFRTFPNITDEKYSRKLPFKLFSFLKYRFIDTA